MLRALPFPELFFGICSPVGTDNMSVVTFIKESLRRYSYESEYFKVTSLMQAVQIPDFAVKDGSIEVRYDSHIKYANRLRDLFDAPDVLANLCCAAVNGFRKEK